MTDRPFPTCLCAPEKPCVACPLIYPCSCGAKVAQRCRRPSGHTGNFVMTHEDRLLRSDVDAIANDAAEVRARLLTQREEDEHAAAAWLTALRSLRKSGLWRGRVDRAVLDELIAIAKHGEIAAGEQLDLGVQL